MRAQSLWYTKKEGRPGGCVVSSSRASSSEGGGYLLSRFRSTIGVAGLNFSVRDGKRWIPRAITTLVFFLSPGPGAAVAAGGVRCKKPWRPEAGLFSLQVLARPIHDIIASCPCLVLSCGCIPKPRQGWWSTHRKGFGLLVSLGCIRYRICTCDLSTS